MTLLDETIVPGLVLAVFEGLVLAHAGEDLGGGGGEGGRQGPAADGRPAGCLLSTPGSDTLLAMYPMSSDGAGSPLALLTLYDPPVESRGFAPMGLQRFPSERFEQRLQPLATFQQRSAPRGLVMLPGIRVQNGNLVRWDGDPRVGGVGTLAPQLQQTIQNVADTGPKVAEQIEQTGARVQSQIRSTGNIIAGGLIAFGVGLLVASIFSRPVVHVIQAAPAGAA